MAILTLHVKNHCSALDEYLKKQAQQVVTDSILMTDLMVYMPLSKYNDILSYLQT